jgi:hypothetical protein
LAIGLGSRNNKGNDKAPEVGKRSDNKLPDSEDLDKNKDRKPVAYAGPEQIVYEGSKVTLEGSYKLDGERPPDSNVLFMWELDSSQIDTGRHVELDNPNIRTPFFYAPHVEFDFDKGQNNNPYTTLTFKLVVTDKRTGLSSDPSMVQSLSK